MLSDGLKNLAVSATAEIVPAHAAVFETRLPWAKRPRVAWLHPRLLGYVALAVGLLLVFGQLRQSAFEVDTTWFLVVRAAGIALAMVIGLTGLSCYRSCKTRSLLFISIGFLGSGLIDSIHAVELMSMDPGFLSEFIYFTKGWSDLAARLFLGAMLLAGWRASEGRITSKPASALDDKLVVGFSVLLLLALLRATLMFSANLSVAHESLLGPATALAGGQFAASLFIFLRRGNWRYYAFQHCFVLALILMTVSQTLYVPFPVRFGDSVNFAGHVAYLAACFMVFVAFLSGTNNLFRQVSSAQQEYHIRTLIGQHGIPEQGHTKFSMRRQKIMNSGTWELDLATGQYTGNRVTIEMMGGLEDARAVRTIAQFLDRIHPDDRDRMVAALHRSQADGELFNQEFRVKTSEGYRWLESIGGIESESGRPIRLLGFVNDVSQRKQVELEKDNLYRELEQVISVVDQHALTASVDLQGVIQAVNPCFCEFFGLGETELLGREFDSLLTTDRPAVSAGDVGIWQSAQGGQTWRGHAVTRDPVTEKRTANATLSPHSNSGRGMDSFVFLGFDVTERVAIRRELEASVQAHKKSNEDLQMFAHIVSHDLQEPLRMVSSFMTLLERRYAADLNQEAREFIQFAVEGATRMRSLLDGVLDYSRVQTRSEPFVLVDLNKAVAEAIANLAVMIRERGAVITASQLPEIQGDSAQITQLFQNLIANGIKFCRDRPPRINIGARRENGHWQVRVGDNGIGIQPAHYAKIFQMFQRLHTREEYPGTGVGLTVCWRIMERHNGSIDLESIEGQGSTFTLNF